MTDDNPKSKSTKLLHRLLTISLIVLVIAVVAFTIYVFINKPTEQEQVQSAESSNSLSPSQESDTVVFEGETEYGYETCYDNGVCVVESAAGITGGSNE